MTTRDTAWPKGTPNWVDLSTPDPAAAQQFYSRLFGWKIVDTGEQFGHYGIAELDGKQVAGIGGQQPGQEQPPAWTTYLATDDIAATAEAITANGGTVVAGPFPIEGSGQMAVAQDPAGAYFGVWQAEGMIGCARVNEPGTLIWNECMTRDAPAARAFYGAVFGHTYTDIGVPGMDYTTIDGEGPGSTVGGMGAMGDDMPAQIPPHWMLYFQVTDADATAQEAKDAGGGVAHGPFDTPQGRVAILTDPQGAMFSVIQVPSGD